MEKLELKIKNKLDSQELKSVLSAHTLFINSFAVFSNGDFASASNSQIIVIWSHD